MGTFVFDFAEGNKDQKDLLGGKGANLAEMTNLGLPVPPGFTITTEACRAYLAEGSEPDGLAARGDRAPRGAREEDGPRLGDADDPLLVSVRSGAKFSMPGMMETVLNVGLNDESVCRAGRARARTSGSPWTPTAGCCRCSAAPCSASTRELFAEELDEVKEKRGSDNDVDLDTDDLRARRHLQGDDQRARRPRVPAGPARAARPGRARGLRLLEHRARRALPPAGADPRGPRHRRERAGRWCSATAAWTPAPASPSPVTPRAAPRASTATTCRTRRARTSSPASATPCRWPTSAKVDKESHDELLEIMSTLEKHYRDMCDIEFTVESGKLWMLQTRVGKRTPEAAFRIAVHMVDEDLIDLDEALQPRDRRPARAADVPALRREGRAHAAGQGHERLPRRGRRQGGLRLGHRRRVGRERRGRHPGPQGDQPRRPARHGGRQGHPDQPRRQDVARRGRGPGHGTHLRVRRRGARGRHQERRVHGPRRQDHRGGRRDLDRRHDRRGVRRRRPGRRLAGGAVLRGRRGRTSTTRWSRRWPDWWTTPTPPAGSGARPTPTRPRTPPGPAVRRPGHRAVPDRAHVPRRPARAGRAPDRRRRREGAAEGRSTRCCRFSARTSRRSSRRWTVCR